MKIRVLLFILFGAAQISAQPLRLVWEDNFDSLNTDRWLVQHNFDHYGGELQVYTSRPENVFVEDGNLILRVLKEEYTCPPEYLNPWRCSRQNNTGKAYQYTSGWVETQPAYNTQYGYIEARIRLPYGRGFWPAFWTFVGEGLESHQNAAEIDIFEMYGHKPATNLETNVHLEYCNPDRFDYPGCPSIPSYGKSHLIPSYANKYHVYGIEWSPEFLKFKFNGTSIRVMNNPGVVDPVRIIMNMAILVGDPPTLNTPFPSDIKVDYVRVYEFDQPTSNHDFLSADIDLNIYPNPAGNFITVNTASSTILKVWSAETINMMGQTVRTFHHPEGIQFDIDVSGLSGGMYQLKLNTDKGTVTKAFVKM